MSLIVCCTAAGGMSNVPDGAAPPHSSAFCTPHKTSPVSSNGRALLFLRGVQGFENEDTAVVPVPAFIAGTFPSGLVARSAFGAGI